MVIGDLETSSDYRLSRLIRVLESVYGLTIDFEAASSRAELKSIYEEYGHVKTKIISESAFNSYYQDIEYTKACIIQEAIIIFLSEVAPKRRPRRAKNSA
jgi:hypothetical protein